MKTIGTLVLSSSLLLSFRTHAFPRVNMSIRKYFISSSTTSSSSAAEPIFKKSKIEEEIGGPAASDALAHETDVSCSVVWTPFSELTGDWRDELIKECKKPYFVNLTTFIGSELRSHKIFPPVNQLFTAFNLCQLKDLKVVIIGQDPYHAPGQVSDKNGNMRMLYILTFSSRHMDSLSLCKEVLRLRRV